jgi:GNAT superfamily N-acetyltransferase
MASSDFGRLYATYLEVVEDGGASPVDGKATEELFESGWLRDRTVYVAEAAGEVVGSYFIRPNFPAFAGHIAQAGYIVSRAARGQGIGTRLVADSIDQARHLGYLAMMFNLVFETNPSRRIYESHGFEIIGRVPEARGAKPAFIYWRRL